MTKHSWMLWLAPAAVWAVYMCWLTGYQNGYEQGHNEGWETARTALMPPRDDVRRLHALAIASAPVETESRPSLEP